MNFKETILTKEVFLKNRPDMEIHQDSTIMSAIYQSASLLNSETNGLLEKVWNYNINKPEDSLDNFLQNDPGNELYRDPFQLSQIVEAMIVQTQYMINMGNDLTQGSSSFSMGGISQSFARSENRDTIAPGVLKLLQNAKVYILQDYSLSANKQKDNCSCDKYETECLTRQIGDKRYLEQIQPNAPYGALAYIGKNHKVCFMGADGSNTDNDDNFIATKFIPEASGEVLSFANEQDYNTFKANYQIDDSYFEEVQENNDQQPQIDLSNVAKLNEQNIFQERNKFKNPIRVEGNIVCTKEILLLKEVAGSELEYGSLEVENHLLVSPSNNLQKLKANSVNNALVTKEYVQDEVGKFNQNFIFTTNNILKQITIGEKHLSAMGSSNIHCDNIFPQDYRQLQGTELVNVRMVDEMFKLLNIQSYPPLPIENQRNTIHHEETVNTRGAANGGAVRDYYFSIAPTFFQDWDNPNWLEKAKVKFVEKNKPLNEARVFLAHFIYKTNEKVYFKFTSISSDIFGDLQNNTKYEASVLFS